ncbi:cobalamin biosynthesis protein CobG [Nakamurella flava]|uniref:Cobalamin biosynthesis protein CobG n=2 Tax=Nakamurella flava TaxID=2576308 RepID=A0A4U6QFL9_9ACTN|nr:cobalamin biosynthesis protein CobG [Nakamurella flava]
MLRPHQAADGAVVRIRLIGGRIRTAALAAVGAAAEQYGDGTVTLTSRGNLQLRGLSVDAHGDADPGLVAAISAAGLLPSRSHERVRNVLVSPLSGIAGGQLDLHPMAARLDEMICQHADLAGLSGRFLFGLDDGRGDISARTVDLGVTAVDESTVRLRVGSWWGSELPAADIVDTLVDRARHFRSLAGRAWRVGDLPATGRELLPDGGSATPVRPAAPSRPLGTLRRDDGGRAALVGVPLGRLQQPQIAALAAIAESATAQDAEVVVTTDRGVVIPRVDADALDKLASAGLLTDATDPRRAVSACTGAPGCHRAEAATGPVADDLGVREAAATGLPVHVIACERRCGAPSGRHLELHVTRAGLHRHLRPTGAHTR